MLSTEVIGKVTKLFKNEEFCKKFFEAIDDKLAVKKILGKNGIDLDEKDVAECISHIKKLIDKDGDGKISADEITGIASGNLVKNVVSSTGFDALAGIDAGDALKNIKKFSKMFSK